MFIIFINTCYKHMDILYLVYLNSFIAFSFCCYSFWLLKLSKSFLLYSRNFHRLNTCYNIRQYPLLCYLLCWTSSREDFQTTTFSYLKLMVCLHYLPIVSQYLKNTNSSWLHHCKYTEYVHTCTITTITTNHITL